MKRASSIVAGWAVALMPAAPALAQPEWHYGPGMMWGGWFHMLFGFFMMILFLGIIVVLVVLGVRWLGTSEHSPFRHGARQAEHGAIAILKERLARGEIDVAEYEERRRALGD